jgi:hypothetical protein
MHYAFPTLQMRHCLQVSGMMWGTAPAGRPGFRVRVRALRRGGSAGPNHRESAARPSQPGSHRDGDNRRCQPK